eukprot:11998616-Prorocentrum_lima.AAC.1
MRHLLQHLDHHGVEYLRLSVSLTNEMKDAARWSIDTVKQAGKNLKDVDYCVGCYLKDSLSMLDD